MFVRLQKKFILKSKSDLKGRHFNKLMILQAVNWYLRYSLSYRDIEELFLERGVSVDHSTLNRWGLTLCSPIRETLERF